MLFRDVEFRGSAAEQPDAGQQTSSNPTLEGGGEPMPQSTHDRAAELHNLAAHTHAAAAVAHGKEDHLSAHELSERAHQHSLNAHKLTQEIATEKAKTQKT